MNFALLVMAAPCGGHGARHAASFAQAAIAQGHAIVRVFFLDDGAALGAAHSVFPQDETAPLEPWLALHEQHNVDLVLCISSALRRGIVDTTEATRHELGAPTAHPAFRISGLGELVDACSSADRLVTFGG